MQRAEIYGYIGTLSIATLKFFYFYFMGVTVLPT